jgi:hypothetical protein
MKKYGPKIASYDTNLHHCFSSVIVFLHLGNTSLALTQTESDGKIRSALISLNFAELPI